MDTATLEAVVRGRSVASAQDPGRTKTDELTQARRAASTSVTLREMAAVHEYTKGTAALDAERRSERQGGSRHQGRRATATGPPDSERSAQDGKVLPVQRNRLSGHQTNEGLLRQPDGQRGQDQVRGAQQVPCRAYRAWSQDPDQHVQAGRDVLRGQGRVQRRPRDLQNRSGADITFLAQLAEAEREVLFPPGVRNLLVLNVVALDRFMPGILAVLGSDQNAEEAFSWSEQPQGRDSM